MRAHVLVAACLLSPSSLGCRGNFDSSPDAPLPDAPPSQPAVLRGCELYLRLDEDTLSSGVTARDSCGDDDPGTPSQVVATKDLERGGVAFFSGNSSMTIANSPRLRATGAVTLSAWVRPMGTVGEPAGGVITKRTSYGVKTSYTMFLWVGSHMWTDVDSENERIDVPVQILADRWVQLGLVYDGAAPAAQRVRTYVNGTRVGTFAESSPSIPAGYDAPVTLGYLPDLADPNLYFKGMMDDVVIWSRALGDDELAEWHRLTTP